jgi:hypothetical protein
VLSNLPGVHTLAALGLLDTHEAAGVVYWCVASGARGGVHHVFQVEYES